ncbi:response regulator [Acetivibrio cellulolyticus]|uniref:response regulator n=1 Tax=Acetivibrio cellulolyticus TaxID=35830 RepID=UPI0001E2F63F|nr:response regulator [Acetivibrio cellulolyticus]
MRILIAEDDYVSRQFLFKLLSQYGECDMVIDGMEAIEAFMMSIRKKQPYDLVCLDIMMPKADGTRVLKAIRELEKQNNIAPQDASKVIMVSALNEVEIVNDSFDSGSEGYAVKPLNTEKFITLLRKLKLID